MKIKLGDILLARNYGLLGWLIRKYTKSKYNHICIYIGNNLLLDTNFFGLKYRLLSDYDKIPHKIIRVKNISKPLTIKICKYARKLKGRYSILSLFRLPNKVGESYNCSQMVNCIYAKFGIVLSDKFIKVTPADIERSKLTFIIKKEK